MLAKVDVLLHNLLQAVFCKINIKSNVVFRGLMGKDGLRQIHFVLFPG